MDWIKKLDSNLTKVINPSPSPHHILKTRELKVKTNSEDRTTRISIKVFPYKDKFHCNALGTYQYYDPGLTKWESLEVPHKSSDCRRTAIEMYCSRTNHNFNIKNDVIAPHDDVIFRCDLSCFRVVTPQRIQQFAPPSRGG